MTLSSTDDAVLTVYEDNRNPRSDEHKSRYQQELDAPTWQRYERAEAAQYNALEGFPLVAAAAIAGTVARLPNDKLNSFIGSIFALRLMHIIVYINVAKQEYTPIHIIILGFIRGFNGPTTPPTVDFGTHCKFHNGLAGPCPSFAAQVQQCQQINSKKIFVSVGGSSGSVEFDDERSAVDAAQALWDTFGAGTERPSWRPFNNTVVDGFDIDHERGSGAYYDTFASTLRALFAASSSTSSTRGEYFISAAPLCANTTAAGALPWDVYPQLDFVWVRFYNANNCQLSGQGFTNSLLTWYNFIAQFQGSFMPYPKLYIGALSFNNTMISGSGSGFVDAFTFATKEIRWVWSEACASVIGGTMLWIFHALLRKASFSPTDPPDLEAHAPRDDWPLPGSSHVEQPEEAHLRPVLRINTCNSDVVSDNDSCLDIQAQQPLQACTAASATASRFSSIAGLHIRAARSLAAAASHIAGNDTSSTSSLPVSSETHSQASPRASPASEESRISLDSADISPTASHHFHRSHNGRRMSRNSTSTLGVDGRETTSWWPRIRTTYDPARKLKPDEIFHQRLFFFAIVFMVNTACLVGALTAKNHAWVFAFILFVKSKDCIQSIYSALALAARALFRLIFPLKPVDAKWILTLIPAYSESEEQIVKTIFSLRDNGVEPHKQVMCVILDGRHRDIREHMTIVIRSWRCDYTTSKQKAGELTLDVGFMEDVPVIVIEKIQNAGKKDSLILCHDLFNWPRDNMPHYSQLLRAQIWEEILPVLTQIEGFKQFDMIFCTDADSTIFKGAVASLANAVARDRNAIAACGILFVELEPGMEWTLWTLYQMFQYAFGQFVRRQAEGLWGKVTCLPGCITMIAVRPECANAIRMYAAPILTYPVIFHQVQYLGTDRRLTFQLLNQGRHLRTLFVPAAVSETAAPQSLTHYLSQRRRWGSNAYYNDWFYVFGKKQALITRAMCFVDVIRLTMVYYRIANTILFLYGLAKQFEILKLIPLIIVSQIPTMWFTFSAVFLYPELRKRGVRLLLGFMINKVMSPAISVTVFTTVVKNLGSQVWGLTGAVSAASAAGAPTGVASGVVVEAARRMSRAKSLGDRLEEDKVLEHVGGATDVVASGDLEAAREDRATLDALRVEEAMMREELDERQVGQCDMEGADDIF
ncbi:MAG: hypothetical protein Q9162_001404 [Coniocarpon cinnabarinum]